MAGNSLMRSVFLFVFAFDSQIWHDQEGFTPDLRFECIDKTAAKLSEKMKAGDKNALIGWSMGGMVAMRAATMAPEMISALALVSTTPKFIRSKDFTHAVPRSLLERLKKRIRTEGITAFHSLVLKDDRSVGQSQISWERAEKELAELERVDLRNILYDIRIPTLIIHGAEDHICLPGSAEYMKEKIAKSELVMIEGVGHAPMIEAPQIFNQHLRGFIERHAG
jgi:pimeloyl-[acyl-carrier protein] methyl ester esterase